MALSAKDFDYQLDPRLIAQQPLPQRDQSRLLVLRRGDGARSHHAFADLPGILRRGDLLVVNDTRVVPARFFCRRLTGACIEGLFLRELGRGLWQALLKKGYRCRPEEELELIGAPDTRLKLLESFGDGRWTMSVSPPRDAVEVLAAAGRAPLPPYIRRDADAADDRADRQRYQTVYAERAGAVAAPTAGLHFTPELLERLAEAGIERTAVTLHVGLGTFRPVQGDELAEHVMHEEWYDLPAAAAAAVNAARNEHRRVVAVGTTSVRVLETAARSGGVRQSSDWTDLFLYPPAEFFVTDALLTNFHLPRSTLLMLAAAFCSPGGTEGLAMLLDAYAEAQQMGYRFYSYGDAMLIL